MRRNFVIITVFILSIILRLINLNRGISGDESAVFDWAHMEFWQLIGALKGADIYPPLTPLFLHFWVMIHDSESWIRLYFVFFGVASCLMVYLIGREYLNKRFAIIAFLFSSISPLLIYLSQYTRSYIDTTVWMLFSTYFFLKLMKGHGTTKNYFFYILGVTASIYTSYIAMLFTMGQVLFIVTFWKSERLNWKKWFLSYCTIGVLFLPWIVSALSQVKNASGATSYWDTLGLRFGGVSLGRYARIFASLFGIDAELLYGGLSHIYSQWILLPVAILIFIAGSLVIREGIVFLNTFYTTNKKMVWIFPFLAIVPIVLALISELLFNFRPIARYFAYSHIMIGFVITSFLYAGLLKKIYIYRLILILVVLLYGGRLYFIYEPEYDTKKSYQYLTNHMQRDDLLIVIRDTNYYLSKSSLSQVRLNSYLIRDMKTGHYKGLSLNFNDLIKTFKNYQQIWFYEVLGNDKIFGANDVLVKGFIEHGYYVRKMDHFKGIDILKLEHKPSM